MIAVTYLAGWALAHPVPVLIFIACAGTLAVLAVLMHAENRRDDRGPQALWREPPRSRARGTRARRHVPARLCRRARAIRAWVTSWFWWQDSPAGWHPWQAARERIALRARGITIDVTTSKPLGVPYRAGVDAGAYQVARDPQSLEHETSAPGVMGTLPEGGPGGQGNIPAAGPTRLATGAERDAPALDYQPAAPFADCLSDETIARGFPAVK